MKAVKILQEPIVPPPEYVVTLSTEEAQHLMNLAGASRAAGPEKETLWELYNALKKAGVENCNLTSLKEIVITRRDRELWPSSLSPRMVAFRCLILTCFLYVRLAMCQPSHHAPHARSVKGVTQQWKLSFPSQTKYTTMNNMNRERLETSMVDKAIENTHHIRQPSWTAHLLAMDLNLDEEIKEETELRTRPTTRLRTPAYSFHPTPLVNLVVPSEAIKPDLIKMVG